jgi:hypothetical protein
MLLCGTSVNGLDFEKLLIDAANHIQIPSLAVLDYWSNYAARFSRLSGDLAYMPCLIAVMDHAARQEMIAENFDPDRLVATGQPAFDDLAACRARFDEGRRRGLRGDWKIDSGQILVTFFSQPLSGSFRQAVEAHGREALGYDEKTILPALVGALAEIGQRRAQEIALVIRPHPREPVHWYQALSAPACSLRLLVTTEGESRDWAMASDLVTGMTSVILVEACYLGCLVASLQIGLKGRDVLPTNRLGLSRAVYQEKDLGTCIEQMLFDRPARSALRARLDRRQNDQGATKKVLALIDRMIDSSIT